MQKFVVLFLLCLTLPGVLAAQQRYVSDELSVDLRREPGTEFRILRMVPSGTPVQVLERNEGWSRVRVGNLEGWILSRFLSDEPAAREQLAEAMAKASRLSREHAELLSEMQDTRYHYQSLQGRYETLQADWEALQQSYQTLLATADEPVRLMEENQRLALEIQRLEGENLRQELENAVLRTDVQRDWLIAGGGVLGAGLLLGLILPLFLRRQRRNREWL